MTIEEYNECVKTRNLRPAIKRKAVTPTRELTIEEYNRINLQNRGAVKVVVPSSKKYPTKNVKCSENIQTDKFEKEYEEFIKNLKKTAVEKEEPKNVVENKTEVENSQVEAKVLLDENIENDTVEKVVEEKVVEEKVVEEKEQPTKTTQKTKSKKTSK